MKDIMFDKLLFTSQYKEKYFYPFTQEDPPGITFLGEAKPNRTCYFCGLNERETPFKDDAHVIPAALGNRYLFTNEECSKCNGEFGRGIDNQFILGVEPFRLFSKNTPKKGKAKIRQMGLKSHFVQMSHDEPLTIISVDGERKYVHPIDDKFVEVQIPQNKFEWICLPKALARMGQVVCSELRGEKYEYIKDWICGKSEIFPSVYLCLITPGISNYTMLSVLEFEHYVEKKIPRYAVVFSFGLMRFVFHFREAGEGLPDFWPLPEVFDNGIQNLTNVITANGRTQPTDIKFKIEVGSKVEEQISD